MVKRFGSFRLSLFHGAQVWFGNAVNVNSLGLFFGRLGFSYTQRVLLGFHVHVEGGQDEVAMEDHGVAVVLYNEVSFLR